MQIHKTCAHNYVKCKSLFVNLVNINSFDCNVFSVTVLPRLGKKKKKEKKCYLRTRLFVWCIKQLFLEPEWALSQ